MTFSLDSNRRLPALYLSYCKYNESNKMIKRRVNRIHSQRRENLELDAVICQVDYTVMYSPKG